jgi:hypothetical protein
MSLTIEEKATTERRSDGPPYYVITLSTWITDRQAAFELAKELSAELAKNHPVDEFGTTIGPEDDNVFGQERIYEYMDGITV